MLISFLAFKPAERPKQIRPTDNLHTEGQFATPEKQKFVPAERPKQVKPIDNLKTEGDFYTPEKPKFSPAERPKQVIPTDNLKTEGDFQRPTKDIFKPAERPKQVKPTDNLRSEGDFYSPDKPKFVPAERPKQIRPTDNLKTEGKFDVPTKDTFKPAERPKQVKPVDNLKMTGDFEGRRKTQEVVTKVDRVQIKKHEDQLKLHDGKMETTTTSQSTFKTVTPVKKDIVVDRTRKDRTKSNITLGSDTSILRTTNQMNYNTITTQKDQRTVTDKSSTDDKRIRDGTLAITTVKITTVLENEKDHTPVREVVRRAGETNEREEVRRTTMQTNVTNRKNIVNQTNIVNESTTTAQKSLSNKENVRSLTNVSDSTHRDIQTGRTSTTDVHKSTSETTDRRSTNDVSSKLIESERLNQTRRATDIDRNRSQINGQEVVRHVTNNDAKLADNSFSTKSAERFQTHDVIDNKREKGYVQSAGTKETYQSVDSSNQNGVSTMKSFSNKSEHTSTKTHTVSHGAPAVDTTSQRAAIQNRQHSQQSSDILNMKKSSHVVDSTKSNQSLAQSERINNQLHLRQEDNLASNSSSNVTTKQTSSRSIQSSSMSNVLNESQSAQRSSSQLSDSNRRDYVSSNAPRSSVSPINNQSGQSHHRRNVLTSSEDLSNSVFHRKSNLATNSNEALHSNSLSSTAAVQRKSISNLHDAAVYNAPSDRQSYSSMHRQNREMHSQTHSSSTSSMATTSHHAQSSSGIERSQKIVKKDNLSIGGGDFYGKSESNSYGSFSTGHQHNVADRVVVNRRSNQSSISFGDGGVNTNVYRREYAVVHKTPCPAAQIEHQTAFKHTRDTKSHKFYKSTPQ